MLTFNQKIIAKGIHNTLSVLTRHIQDGIIDPSTPTYRVVFGSMSEQWIAYKDDYNFYYRV